MTNTIRPRRMERHDIVLDDGHRVGVSTCGDGTPFVMIHGLGGEGMVYGRTLTRIAELGFRIIAIDSGGHGRTDGLGTTGWRWSSYVDLHHRALRALGIDRAVLAGHSMGGKVAVDLAAKDPDRAAAVIAINAPIGRPYRSVAAYRGAATLIPMQAALLATDLAVAAVRSRREIVRNAALISPGQRRLVGAIARVPGAFAATVWDGPSTGELRQLQRHRIPTAIIHSDRDLAIRFDFARAAADTANATLVRVHGGGHIWLLEDSDTLPAIIAALVDDDLVPGMDHPDVTPNPAIRQWSIERRPQPPADGAPR